MKVAIKPKEKCKSSKKINFLLYTSLTLLFCNYATKCAASAACDKSRQVFSGYAFGEISHGINSNYTQVKLNRRILEIILMFVVAQDSHCEWLIEAANESQFINLKFLSMKTECSYDYVSQ